MKMLSKKDADEYMLIAGEVRGMAIKDEWRYVLKEKGTEGIEKLEKEFARLGHPLRYDGIRVLAFYPVGYDVLSTLLIRDIFDFTDDDFFKMGQEAPKNSVIIKVMAKYFLSLRSAVTQAAKLWRQYYTFGGMEVVEVNEEEKHLTLRLRDYPYATKIACHVVRGYISQVAQMVINREVQCVEKKCMFDGDVYHEFFVTWQ